MTTLQQHKKAVELVVAEFAKSGQVVCVDGPFKVGGEKDDTQFVSWLRFKNGRAFMLVGVDSLDEILRVHSKESQKPMEKTVGSSGAQGASGRPPSSSSEAPFMREDTNRRWQERKLIRPR